MRRHGLTLSGAGSRGPGQAPEERGRLKRARRATQRTRRLLVAVFASRRLALIGSRWVGSFTVDGQRAFWKRALLTPRALLTQHCGCAAQSQFALHEQTSGLFAGLKTASCISPSIAARSEFIA